MKRQWLDEFLARRCVILSLAAPVVPGSGTLRGRFAAKGIPRNTADLEGCAIPRVNPFLPGS